MNTGRKTTKVKGTRLLGWVGVAIGSGILNPFSNQKKNPKI